MGATPVPVAARPSASGACAGLPSRHIILGGVLLLASQVACNSAAPTACCVDGIPALALRGTVVTSVGTPVAGASVRSRSFRSDCTTPVPVERDTLLVSDAAGAFSGILVSMLGGPGMCLRVEASPAGGGVEAVQTLPVQFRVSYGRAPLDTARVRLVLP